MKRPRGKVKIPVGTKGTVIGVKIQPRHWWPELTGKSGPEFKTIPEMRRWQEAQKPKPEGQDTAPLPKNSTRAILGGSPSTNKSKKAS